MKKTLPIGLPLKDKYENRDARLHKSGAMSGDKHRQWTSKKLLACVVAIFMGTVLLAILFIFSPWKKKMSKDIILIISGGEPEVLGFNDIKVSCSILPPALPIEDTGFNLAYPIFFQSRNNSYFCSSGMMSVREFLNNTMLWNPAAEHFIPGPDLPFNLAFHCIVTINDTHAFLAGGDVDQVPFNLTLMFTRGKWIEMPPMLTPKIAHACGLLGNNRVAVVGGADITGAFLATVEVFDLETGIWSIGTPMPEQNDFASTMKIDDTVLFIGGSLSEKIYQYDEDKNAWQHWKQVVKSTGIGPLAVYKMSASDFKCKPL